MPKPICLNLNPLIIKHADGSFTAWNQVEITNEKKVYQFYNTIHQDTDITFSAVINGQQETFYGLSLTNEEERVQYDNHVEALTQINENNLRIWKIAGPILLAIGVFLGLALAIVNPPLGTTYFLTLGGVLTCTLGGIKCIAKITSPNSITDMIVELQDNKPVELQGSASTFSDTEVNYD